MQDSSARCCSAVKPPRRKRLVLSRITLSALLLVLALVQVHRGAAESATGVRLIMIEEPGCAFCLRWRKEVEPGYVRSEEGRIAPLVHAMRDDPAVSKLPRIVYTPTFVLMQDQREIGRIVGYAGPDLFWWQIKPLLDTLPND